MISESDVELNVTPALAQLGVQLDGVDEVAVVGERELAAVAAGPVGAVHRLRVLPLVRARRRVADVPDRELAAQRAQVVLLEDLVDEAQLALGDDVAAASAAAMPADSWPRCWSAYSAKYGEAGDVVPGRVDPEDAALVARSVALVGEGLGCRHWRPPGRRATPLNVAAGPAAALARSARAPGPGRCAGPSTGTAARGRRAPRAARRAAGTAIARRSVTDSASPPTSPKTRAARVPRASSRTSRGPDTTKPPGPSPKRPAIGSSLGPRSSVAPIPPARQHSATRDEEPALGDVVAARQRARAHGVADGLDAPRGPRRRRRSGRPSGSGSPQQLGQLARGERRARTRRRSRPRRPARAKPEPPGAARVGQAADHADHRRRVDRARRALVVERHVAADDRASRARGTRRRGRAPPR